MDDEEEDDREIIARMWPQSQRSRRIWCRAFFVAGCLLPTVAVAAVAVWRQLPAHVRAAEAELSAQLGLPVRLSGVSHPRPHVTVYHVPEVVDIKSGSPLCRARWVEVDASGDAVILDVAQFEIEPAGQRELWRLLQSNLQDRSALRDLVISAGEVTLHGQTHAQTLTQVRTRIAKQATNASATVQFRVAGLDMPQPASLQIIRKRKTDSTMTTLHLQTGSSPLPCALFAPLLPDVTRFGPAAGFSGSLHAQESIGGWYAALSGELDNLDLYSLVTAHYPHRLNGPAHVRIAEARFGEGRLQAASGQLSAGPGVVSRSLLGAADAWLGTPTPNHTADGDGLVLYEQLSVRFDIDQTGLRITGDCGAAGSGRIMVNRSGVLLADSPIQPVPVVALIRMLVPENAVQVPATRETEPLVSWLPVPHIQRPDVDGSGEQPPGARLLRSPR